MKSMSLKTKILISWILFVVIFAALLTVASFYDLEISQILTKGTLPEGEYISTNGFGLFFEAIGSAPIWILGAIAGCIFYWYSVRKNKKWLAVIMGIAIFVAIFLFVADIFKYVTEHMGNIEYSKIGYVVGLESMLAIIIALLLVMQWGRISAETNQKLIKWAWVIICTIAAYLFVSLIKAPFGRMRYRTLNNLGDFSGYTDWYVINGKRSIEGLPSDCCKSFPSGHTYSAGLIYTLLCLPYLVDKLSKTRYKVLLWVITIGYTGTVAISRIVVGAHYMSDVLVGGTFAFLFSMLFREIFVCKYSHFKAVFGKKQKTNNKINNNPTDIETEKTEA